MIPDWLAPYFHSTWLPIILFLGAFGDAFIGSSLFILGEVFFVAGGYALALSGGFWANWWIIPLVWFGALAGDLGSYAVGVHYGEKIVDKFIRGGAKRRYYYQRAKKIMQKRGSVAIFTARITGPVAKFMPFIAGTMKLPFYTVFLASLWGVIIGTFQFFLVGYFLAQGLNYWNEIWQLIQTHPVLFLLLLSALLATFFLWRKTKK